MQDFKAKNMTENQVTAFIEERKWEYRCTSLPFRALLTPQLKLA